MKTLLINASPKAGGSASRRLLELTKRYVDADLEVAELHEWSVPPGIRRQLKAADNWVFFTPLYVDALPSHLLSCLVELSGSDDQLGPACVYGVVNCGFFEGEQTRYALEVLRNWAVSMGLLYGGGVGTGGGGSLMVIPDAERGPCGPVIDALQQLAGRLRDPADTPETIFTTVAVPRFLYKLAGEAGWRHDIRRHGGRPRQLGTRKDPPEGR